MNPAETVIPPAVFRKAGLRETTVLLAVAWVIPFAVHLAPWSETRPLGAYLLPMFWATFVAVYLYGLWTGLLVGLFAPALNLLVTGLPAGKFLGPMSVELMIFAVVTAWAISRYWRFVLLAPLGYVVAKTAATILLMAMAGFQDSGLAALGLGRSLMVGLVGLWVLAAINASLVWFYPKTAAGER